MSDNGTADPFAALPAPVGDAEWMQVRLVAPPVVGAAVLRLPRERFGLAARHPARNVKLS